MKKTNMLVLNDSHMGAVRTAGTTHASRLGIQNYLQTSLVTILEDHEDKDVALNGDLFDTFDVETSQLLQVYMTFDGWLRRTGKKLHLVRGNHDISKNSTKTSSFAFLCSLLKNAFPEQVFVYIDELAQVEEVIWVIPHCVNQDLFELELGKALEVATPGFLLLHANCDNNFAVEADHSLNVSDEWVRKLIKFGWTLVFAHEHQRRDLHAGQVRIMGNQWPTSVADCLSHGEAQKDGKKYAHVFQSTVDEASGNYTMSMKPVQTWDREGDYTEVNWRELTLTDHRFIRVTGDAKSDEAADVINAIHRFRLASQAFVITNSVKIEGVAGINDMASLTEDRLQAVNVRQALLDELTADERKVVNELLDGRPKTEETNTENEVAAC